MLGGKGVAKQREHPARADQCGAAVRRQVENKLTSKRGLSLWLMGIVYPSTLALVSLRYSKELKEWHMPSKEVIEKDLELLFEKLNELSIRLEELEESLGIRNTT